MKLDGYKKLIAYCTTVVGLTIIAALGSITGEIFATLFSAVTGLYFVGQGIADSGRK